MKCLGVDFGSSYVGLAIGDTDVGMAFPRGVVARAAVMDAIVALVHEEKVKKIVLGESLASNEEKNDIHTAAARFAEQLKEATGLPIFFEREDFSSVEAHRYQTDAGRRDDSAAAIILQRFLDKQKREYTDDHGTNE